MRPGLVVFLAVAAVACDEGTSHGSVTLEAPRVPETPPPAIEVPVEPEPAPAVEVPRWPLAIDTHCDTTQRILDRGDDVTTRLPNGHLDVPRMREGGLSAAFLSVWVDPRRYPREEAWARTEALMGAIEALVAAHPDEIVLARTAREVREAHAAGRIAFLIGVEGAHALGDAEPEVLFTRLESLARRGVRYVTLTWTNDNVFAHASTGGHPSRGLTDVGRELVGRMNVLGVMIDVSHTSDATAIEAASLSRVPVLASHSGARTIGDHRRNVSDEVIRAIAERGGAICANYYADFVDPEYGDARDEVERAHRAELDAIEGRSWETNAERNALIHRVAPELVRPPLSRLVDHIAHLVEIGGEGAACLGSDYDGTSELAGMDDVTDLPELFAAIEARGLPVAPILGENVLRVLAASAGE